jgi:hypothetical protein
MESVLTDVTPFIHIKSPSVLPTHDVEIELGEVPSLLAEGLVQIRHPKPISEIIPYLKPEDDLNILTSFQANNYKTDIEEQRDALKTTYEIVLKSIENQTGILVGFTKMVNMLTDQLEYCKGKSPNKPTFSSEIVMTLRNKLQERDNIRKLQHVKTQELIPHTTQDYEKVINDASRKDYSIYFKNLQKDAYDIDLLDRIDVFQKQTVDLNKGLGEVKDVTSTYNNYLTNYDWSVEAADNSLEGKLELARLKLSQLCMKSRMVVGALKLVCADLQKNKCNGDWDKLMTLL